MASQYDRLKEEYFPKDLIVDIATRYYGEERRQAIKDFLDINIVFLVDNQFKLRLRELFEEKYKSSMFGYDYTDELVEKFFTNISNLIQKGVDSFNPEEFKKDADIFEKLGFDIMKILKKDKQTGKVVLADSEETQRLIDCIVLDNKSEHVSLYTFSVLKAYNEAAEKGGVVAPEFKIEEGEENKFYINVANSFIQKVESTSPNNDLELLKIKEDISLEHLQMLNKILTMRGSNIGVWKDEKADIFVECINELFNTKYSSISEITGDPKMSYFLSFRAQCAEYYDQYVRAYNLVNKGVLAPEGYQIDNGEVVRYALENPDVLQWTEIGDKNRIVIIAGRYAIDGGTTIHESNHALTNVRQPLNRSIKEIINEYLKTKMVKFATYEEKVRLKIRENGNCAYSAAVVFMLPFLDMCEEEMKNGVFSRTVNGIVENVKSLIGEENWQIIEEQTKKIEDRNWGHFVRAINIDGKKIRDVNEFIQEYRKNPDLEIPNDISLEDRQALQEAIEFDKFLCKIVEHKSEFKQGNIQNFSMGELENSKPLTVDEN